MSNWSTPTWVEINGEKYDIRNRCDYRVILDTIEALDDKEEDSDFKLYCALNIFYQNPQKLPNIFIISDNKETQILNEAITKMMEIINIGNPVKKQQKNQPKIMDWKHDFKNIAAPLSHVLGYSVRDENNYTHWYDFIGAYSEIKECYWSEVIKVRGKIIRHESLDENEKKFYSSHKDDIDLPNTLSTAEEEWLNEDF